MGSRVVGFRAVCCQISRLQAQDKDFNIRFLTGKGAGGQGDLALRLAKSDLQGLFHQWMEQPGLISQSQHNVSSPTN